MGGCKDCDWLCSEWKDYYDGYHWEEIEVYICERTGNKVDSEEWYSTDCEDYLNSFEEVKE